MKYLSGKFSVGGAGNAAYAEGYDRTFTSKPIGRIQDPRKATPIVKWAGGKTRLLGELLARMPGTYRRYLEPFAGGAALFFRVAPATAYLADTNADLIECYRAVRDRVDDVIAALAAHREAHDEGYFYADPPYHPVSDTADFTSYTSDRFSEDDQRALAEVFRALDACGAAVMLSNSDTPFIRRLYAGYRVDRVMCARAINSRASARGAVAEVIIRNRY